MRPGIDPQHFAGMRKSRRRGVGLKGDLDGFRAANPVWTCKHCTYETRANPYAKPYTRAKPQPCQACKSMNWAYSASQSEADRYAELKRCDDVHFLSHPPKAFALHAPIRGGGLERIRTYTPDFSYTRGSNASLLTFEDHKPHNQLTQLAKLVHRWVLLEHGIDVLVTWYTGRGKSRRIQQAWSSALR